MGIQELLEALNEAEAASYWVEVRYDPSPVYDLRVRSDVQPVGELEGEYDPDFRPTAITVRYDTSWRYLRPLLPYLELK